MFTRTTIAVMIVAASLALNGTAHGATWYVDVNSPNDPGTGTLADPFRKIKHVLQYAKPPLTGGDVVLVKGGTYYEDGKLEITCSGSQNNYITFKPYNNEVPIIQPSKCYTGWATDSNGIHYKTFQDFNATLGSLVKKNGYGITKVSTYDELLDPSIDVDLFHFKQSNNTLYVKLESGSPAVDVYVIPDVNRVQINAVAGYVEVRGFTIQYGYEGVKCYADNVRLIDNTIKHTAWHGVLVVDGSDVLIEGNNISYTGKPLQYKSGELVPNNQDHSMYLGNVERVTVRENHMEKCIGGQSMHPWSIDGSFPKNCDIYNNYIEGGYGGFVGSGTNNKVYNNIILSTDVDRWGLNIYPSSGYQIYNNVIKGSYGIQVGFTGQAQAITFKNNIVRTDVKDVNIVSFNGTIDYNVYYGGSQFVVGSQIFTDFTAYRDYMVKQYNCEANSRYDNPEFISDTDYHLRPNSPCIDAGDNGVGLTEDYDGNQRPLSGGFIETPTIDIGPYEYAGYPGEAFHLKGASDRTVAYFDYLGNLVLTGAFTQDTTPSASANDEFRIQNSVGTDVAIIDATNGNMYIKGWLHEQQGTLQNPASDDFIVKDSNGNIVAYVNSSGDLYLKGKLYQSQ